jgi:hypothetical protein
MDISVNTLIGSVRQAGGGVVDGQPVDQRQPVITYVNQLCTLNLLDSP